MPHHNSVLHDLLKQIPWSIFDDLVARHGTDFRSRKLRSKDHLTALLFAQFSGAHSIREITGGLQSHSTRLYHLGARPVARSTLADANASRSHALFADLFAAMVQRAGRGLRRKMGEAVHLIDSTTIPLSAMSADWARFSKDFCGAKLHLVLDADEDRPVHAAITPARVNDITPAHDMPIAPGATYVFDLGYYNFGWWARLDAAGCRIVTRLKTVTPLTDVTELALPEAVPATAGILSDRIGHLPERQKAYRRNPFRKPVREIRVRLESGKVLRVMSNDLDAPAQEIADLYKRRWAIELFFRWVKQTLRITRFIGTSENAVRIQISVALIAYMLLRLAQKTQSAVTGALAFARLVRSNLMHQRRLDQLLEPRPTLTDDRQMMLAWN